MSILPIEFDFLLATPVLHQLQGVVDLGAYRFISEAWRFARQRSVRIFVHMQLEIKCALAHAPAVVKDVDYRGREGHLVQSVHVVDGDG